MEEYFRRANELKESVIGNYEHSTDIQDYELVEWLIEQAKTLKTIADTWVAIETKGSTEEADDFYTIVQDILTPKYD